MLCQVNCSVGEVVDKFTILKIKKGKTQDPEKLLNINNELTLLEQNLELVNNEDELFDKLLKINNKLWILEDLIREKSKNQEFDKEYINYAESIHTTNDQRYLIKKEINNKYGSELKEEKIYKNLDTQKNINKIAQTTSKKQIKVDVNDMRKLEKGKMDYTNGNYDDSMDCINRIMKKYKDYDNYDAFFIDLLFSYSNICCIYNKKYPYFDKLQYILSAIDSIDISEPQKDFCKSLYTTKCLDLQKYEEAYTYIGRINSINAPNVNFNNMSFFNEEDVDKTLLIYDGGGIGDKFMLSRFIPKLSSDYYEKKNKASTKTIERGNFA